jgi:hypothetical protein
MLPGNIIWRRTPVKSKTSRRRSRSNAPGAAANLVCHTVWSSMTVSSRSTERRMGIFESAKASTNDRTTEPNCSSQWFTGVYSWLSAS